MDIQNIWYSQMHCTCPIGPPLWSLLLKGVVFETRINVRLVDQESLAGIFSQDPSGTGMIGLLIWRILICIPWIYGMSGMMLRKSPARIFLSERSHAFWQASLKWKRRQSSASFSVWYPVCYSTGACSLFCIWFHSSSKYQKQPPADL